MYIGEKILSKLSMPPEVVNSAEKKDADITGRELDLLRREFPDFHDLVTGKHVVDFGCGAGKQSVSLCLEEGCKVCGIDINENSLSRARELAFVNNLTESQILFSNGVIDNMHGKYDVVISKDAMEHFPDPVAILNEMADLIKSDGKLLITFGPPWYAPYGSHMHFFCKLPWVNLLFSEKTVMRVRSKYKNDGAMRYQDVESGLNKLTLHKFENIVKNSGLVFNRFHYSCVKGQTWLSKIPVLRELFVNHVTCILSKS